MNNLSLKQRLIAILSIFAFLITLILILISRQSSSTLTPIILSSQPANNSQNASLFSPIKLIFNSPIDPSLVSISSAPPEIWTVQANGNSLILEHEQFFHADTNYTLQIYYDNRDILTLTFHTIHQQGDPRYTIQATKELFEKYPLATSFPYETTTLRAVYISPMTLEITLKTTSLTGKEAISQIKSWVTKNGGNPSAHEYLVVSAPQPSPPEPSPTP